MTQTVVNWLGGGFLAFVSAILYAILRGKLVPKATVDAQLKGKDEQIADTRQLADSWKTAFTETKKVVDELAPAVKALTEGQATIVKVVSALPASTAAGE